MVSDIAYSNSNSNVFLNSVKYLKPIGYGATGISVLSDVLLIIDGQQSLTETGINSSIMMISMASLLLVILTLIKQRLKTGTSALNSFPMLARLWQYRDFTRILRVPLRQP
jgi:hypothetical protein